jgi:hypothetical protein
MRMTTSRKMRWVGHQPSMGEMEKYITSGLDGRVVLK